MINPNKLIEANGIVKSVEKFTSMTVYKIDTNKAILDYTVFGTFDTGIVEGMKLNVTIGYSMTLDNYVIKYINYNKVA